MKLSECEFGIVVNVNGNNDIGMIKGLSKNTVGEVVPLIEFPDGDVRPVHYGNLEKYKD